MSRCGTRRCWSVALTTATLLASHSTARAENSAGVSAVAGRALVVRYFEALDAHRFASACAMLGAELRADSGGDSCPTFLRTGMPDPLRYRIERTRVVRGGVDVVVRLGQNELDHVRMRTWLAIVRVEDRTPRIVATRLLR